MKTLSLTLLLALAACTTTGHGEAAPDCIPVKYWSHGDQAQLANLMAQQPPESPLWGVMRDYGRMRAEARACAGDGGG